MIKKVNITARIPIKNVKPPIHGHLSGVKMDTADILKCLNKRAIVDEILDNGSTVRLTIRNYYKDNNVSKKETKTATTETKTSAATTAKAKIETKSESTKINVNDAIKAKDAAVVVVEDKTAETNAETTKVEEVKATTDTKAEEAKTDTATADTKVKTETAETKVEETNTSTTETKTTTSKKISLEDTMIPARSSATSES